MADLGNFNAADIEPTAAFKLFPAGKYRVEVVASEKRVPRSGVGEMLCLQLSIIEPSEFAGQMLFDNLNIEHQNPTVSDIASRSLSALCHACGKVNARDSEELHFIPVDVSVTVSKPKEGYDPRNNIRYIIPDDAAPARKPAPAAAPRAAQAAAPAAGTKPWNRGR